MTTIRIIIRKGFITLAIALMAVMPLGTLSNVSAEEACTAPADSTFGSGVRHPVGSDAVAFTYQCDNDNGYQGKWLSERFIYDPVTDTEEPIDPVTYTYNDTTNKYDYSYWNYSASRNVYKLVDAATTTPPAAGAKVKVIGAPKPKPTVSTPANGSSTAQQSAASVAATGSGTTNNSNATSNSSGTVTNNSGVNVTNTIGATTTSGNATVLKNTNAGSATSGDAVTQADVTNMLQSSSNALGDGSQVATFTYTIDGDVTGDLFFDPSMINGVQGDTTTNKSMNNNLVINNTSDASITNNLTLASESGNATVDSNTNAGNATSGNAKTVANITNLIRSSIVSGKSFVGTVNITGNLNGDILLPADFVDTLIAANTPTVAVSGPNSSTTSNNTVNNNTKVTNNNTQGVSNTITSTATSGNATVDKNTNAGSAKSGKAETNVTAFNLTGSKVIAKNSILVYVNVTGKWTGLIVNAPAGATAAQLGGKVTENTSVTNNATVNNNVNQKITNNVGVTAKSGDASVTRNTTAGDATAGNAETAVNISNIEDSTFELSDWFGILYINVFGTWNGSFGMNTSAGDQPGGRGADQEYLVGNVGSLVRYPATTVSKTTTTTGNTPNNSATSNTTTKVQDGAVLAAETKVASAAASTPAPQLSNEPQSAMANLWLPAIGLLLGLGILGTERLLNRRTK
jgi:hypothetical protein